MQFFDNNFRVILSYLPNILAALLILIVGWIVAAIVSGAVKGLLKRTDVDNRIARSMGGSGVNSERVAGTIAFWLVMLFVLVAFFQALDLPVVSVPLNTMLGTVLAFLPRLLSAALLFAIAWVVATVLKRLVTGALTRTGVDRRIGGMMSDDPATVHAAVSKPVVTEPVTTTTAPSAIAPAPRISLAQTLGEVVYWVVFLLFLPAILGTLDLGGILAPVNEMMNRIFSYLPNVLAAALIMLVGWFVARVVRKIVTGLLAASGVDNLGQRLGLGRVIGGQSLSDLIGLLVYIFILVPVAISALNALAIDVITRPATEMLTTFLAAIPNIFAAAVVLAISYIVGRLVAGLISSLLAGIGFNNLPARLGMGGTSRVGQLTPAELVGSLALTAIMLFATVEALRLLGFASLATLLSEFIVLGGQIILGLIVFAVGLWLANFAAEWIRSSGTANAGLLAIVARTAILVLAGAMALRQMGIANEIVSLAFGLLLGAVAVASAIAFGIGGRDVAGRKLEEWVKRIESRRGPPAAAVNPATGPAGGGAK